MPRVERPTDHQAGQQVPEIPCRPCHPPESRIATSGSINFKAEQSRVVLLWLGRSFSTMPEARRLVTSGPYRYMRHPLYLTEEIAVIGVLLQYRSPAAFALVALQMALQVRRMLCEEQVLGETFPEYEQYCANTPRLV